MSIQNVPFYSLNAGLVGADALGRIDMAKMRIAAEEMTNLLPSVLGPAQTRPGTAYYTSTLSDNAGSLVPFVFNSSTKALIELTSLNMRVLIDGLPVTRPTVSASVPALSSWTQDDDAGAVSVAGSQIELLGTGYNYARRRATVTTSSAGTEHALRITISVGPILFRIGSSAGADDLLAETLLSAGTHSIAVTPAGNFYLTASSFDIAPKFIDSVAIESAGAMVLPTEWTGGDIANLRYVQSGDVLFCAADGKRQRKIERRSQRSWSIVYYLPPDGPFRIENFTSTAITPSNVAGPITLASSRAVFRTGHVGALFRFTHHFQTQFMVLAGQDQYTGAIRCSSVVGSRAMAVGITGTFSGTLRLQRSFGIEGDWEDVPMSDHVTDGGYVISWTGTTAGDNYEDEYDNQIVYYRVGFKAGEYTSGSANVTIILSGGIQTGIVRITGVSDALNASAQVLETLGSGVATSEWAEGEWSGYRGYPGSVSVHDGRVWWGWRDKVFGSVSDAYESFDDGIEGDAAPISRSIATGGFERIYSLLSNQRLLAFSGAQELSIRSSSLDEPLTPTQFKAVAPSERGSGNLQSIKVDSRAIFVDRTLKRIFEMVADLQTADFASREITRLCPDICRGTVVSVAVQRKPDTRIYFVLSDGSIALCTYEPSDEVVAWSRIEPNTGAKFQSVCVLPGTSEDEVWFIVERTIASNLKHYVEKLATLAEVECGTLNKAMDCHLVYSGSSTSTITGLSHLNGEQVVVWGNGAPLVTIASPLTVSGGSVTLPSAVTSAVVGIPYRARFKSTKLAYAAQAGTALLMKKAVKRLGMLMRNVVMKGVKVGRDFTHLHELATTYRGKAVTATQVLPEYDQDLSPFDGAWSTDSRVCFEVNSPYSAKVLGFVIDLRTNEGLDFSRGKAAEASS